MHHVGGSWRLHAQWLMTNHQCINHEAWTWVCVLMYDCRRWRFCYDMRILMIVIVFAVVSAVIVVMLAVERENSKKPWWPWRPYISSLPSSSRYPHRQGSLRTEAILLHMESMGKLALSMNYVVTVAAGEWWIQKWYFWRSCFRNKMNGTTSHYVWLNIGLWDNMFAILALLVRYHYNGALETQFDAVRSWNRLLISPFAQL